MIAAAASFSSSRLIVWVHLLGFSFVNDRDVTENVNFLCSHPYFLPWCVLLILRLLQAVWQLVSIGDNIYNYGEGHTKEKQEEQKAYT